MAAVRSNEVNQASDVVSAAADSSAPSDSSPPASVQILDPFKLDLPIADKRDYRYIILPNKLEALLISDPNCDRAACAVNVKVGSLFDPPELQGLTHFLEHMLFLGTEKYPNEEEYNKYLQEHGGTSNAYTSDLNTCYHFSLNPDHLDGAIDRFCQFFLSPLFTQSATTRELDAVHSEHSKNILNDSCRTYQLCKHLSNPNHPFRLFGTGNHLTLRDEPKKKGIDVREALLEFHKKHYSSNIMRLCVVGRNSLDDLQKMVCDENRFLLVKNTDIKIPEGEEIGGLEVPFRKEDLGKIIKTVLIKDARILSFSWLLPEQTKRWQSKPIRYMIHLLGHEAEGSVLSALKAEGLATELFAGPSIDIAGISLFQLKINLTDAAINDTSKINRVAQLVHEYIKLISSQPIQEWVLDELENLAAMEFKFLSILPPEDFVVFLSHCMQILPPDRLLSGVYLIWKRDIDEIKEMIGCLTPEKLLVQLSAKTFENQAKEENWKKEPYYETSYKVDDLTEETKQVWLNSAASEQKQPSVSFPIPNPFIAKSFDLKPRQLRNDQMQKHPQLLIPDVDKPCGPVPHFEASRAFFKQDNEFDLPKAVVMLRFSCDFARNSLRNMSVMELYLLTIKELINEMGYHAQIAGLNYALLANIDSMFSGDLAGFEIQLSGYNDRLHDLAESLCKAVKNPEMKRDAFDVAKSILIRKLKFAAQNKQPYQQAIHVLHKYLTSPQYLPHERLASVEQICYEDICDAATSGLLLKGLSVDSLIQGNLTELEAINLMFSVGKILSIDDGDKKEAKAVKISDRRVEKLKPAKVVDLGEKNKRRLVRIRTRQMASNTEESNNAVVLGIQVGISSIRESAFLSITTSFISRPFFDQLRTKQQLGYIVSCSLSRLLHCNFLLLIVQSTVLPPHSVTERIEAFLEEYLVKAEEHLSEEEFEKLRQGTIAQLEEKPKHLGEDARRHFSELAGRRFDFTRKEKQVEYLKSATRKEFIEFLNDSLYKSPWFAVEVASHKTPSAAADAADAAAAAEGSEEKTSDTNDAAAAADAAADAVDAKSSEEKEIPLKPSAGADWEDAGDDGEKFVAAVGREFYEFPLPGGQVDIGTVG